MGSYLRLYGIRPSWDPARIRATNDASGLRVDLDSLPAQNTPGRRVRPPRLGIGRRVVTGRSSPTLLATIYLSLELSGVSLPTVVGRSRTQATACGTTDACGLRVPTPSPTNRHKSTEYRTFASILASGLQSLTVLLRLGLQGLT